MPNASSVWNGFVFICGIGLFIVIVLIIIILYEKIRDMRSDKMKDNQYFVDLREKFDVMEKYIEEIKNMVIKIRISLNDLSKDMENGRVATVEEAKRRVDSIRMFGVEIPPKGCEDAAQKEANDTTYDDPVITCTCEEGLFIPEQVDVDFTSPLNDRLTKEGVRGAIPTIIWFIKHMIPAKVIVYFNDDIYQVNTYTHCELVNLVKSREGVDPYLTIGKYEECITTFGGK